MLPEPIAVTLQVTDVFEALGVPYFIGGSLASAIYGISRATMDVDVVADLQEEHVKPFATMLGDTFYVDDEAIHSAIRLSSSFNIIHRDSMFKVDVFIRNTRPFDQSQLDRRVLLSLATDPERNAYFASPEDTVLAKLEWYQMGGGVSDRQWRDVLNVLKVQGDRLDRGYLRLWAIRLGIIELLERALTEALG